MIFRPEIELLVHMCFPSVEERQAALATATAVGHTRAMRNLTEHSVRPALKGFASSAASLALLASRGKGSLGALPMVNVELSGPRLDALYANIALGMVGGTEAIANGPTPTRLVQQIENVVAKAGIAVGLGMLNLARLQRYDPARASQRRAMHLLELHKRPGVPLNKPNARLAVFGHTRTQKEQWKRFRPVIHLWAATVGIAYQRKAAVEPRNRHRDQFTNYMMDCITETVESGRMLRQARWFADFADAHRAPGAEEQIIPLKDVDLFDKLAEPEEPTLAPLTEDEIMHLKTYRDEDS